MNIHDFGGSGDTFTLRFHRSRAAIETLAKPERRWQSQRDDGKVREALAKPEKRWQSQKNILGKAISASELYPRTIGGVFDIEFNSIPATSKGDF